SLTSVAAAAGAAGTSAIPPAARAVASRADRPRRRRDMDATPGMLCDSPFGHGEPPHPNEQPYPQSVTRRSCPADERPGPPQHATTPRSVTRAPARGETAPPEARPEYRAEARPAAS